MAHPPYDDLLALACEVAEEAARLVADRRRRGVRVAGTKSSQVDIVTEVDRAAEALIRDRLLADRPGDGFLGEEGGESDGSTTGVTWVVDPIDGTVNFLYGIPQYAVSIAARVDDVVVAGVVLNVGTGERFTATSGGGSFRDGERLRVRDTVPLAERLVLTGFSYVAEVRARQAEAVSRLLPRVRDIRRFGSAALDLCAVAAGRADGYVEEGVNPWDVAAGGLVATEAGARLRTGTGTGGMRLVVCAPEPGFEALSAAVQECGFVGPRGWE